MKLNFSHQEGDICYKPMKVPCFPAQSTGPFEDRKYCLKSVQGPLMAAKMHAALTSMREDVDGQNQGKAGYWTDQIKAFGKQASN